MHLAPPPRAACPVAATGAGAGRHRAALATDWLVRTAAPAWLDLTCPDPVGLADLRKCPVIDVLSDTRTARIAVGRAIRAVLAARMSVCNRVWSHSQRMPSDHQALAAHVVERVLPRLHAAFADTGFGAAMAAAARAPCTNRWSTLRDHLEGLAQAAAAALAWQAAFDARLSVSEGEDAWVEACGRAALRELRPLAERLQPNAHSLALRILTP